VSGLVRRSVRLALVVCELVACCSWGSQAADAASTGPAGPVSVVGGANSLAIGLVGCPAGSQGASGERCPASPKGSSAVAYVSGTVALTVVSSSDVLLSLQYVRTVDGSVTQLPGTSTDICLLAPVDTCAGMAGPIQLSKRQPTVLVLRFAQAASKPSSDLDGTLVFSAAGVTSTSKTPAGGPVISVTAATQAFGAIRIEPPTLVLSNGADTTGTVDLVGPGLPALLSQPGLGMPKVRLGGGDPNGPVATLTLPASAATRAEPDRVTATVSLSAFPSPGKYTGTLALSDTAPNPPTLSVEVDSHRSEWLAFGLLVGGVLVGALAQPLFTLIRRRSMMRSALHESVAAYKKVCHQPVAWDISDLVGQGRRGRLQGAQAVRVSIGEARSTVDLDEDNDRVLNIVARIQRWLRAEPAARRLSGVVDQDPPATDDRVELPWSKSNTSLDSYILLEAARSEPPNADAADDVVARLLRQTEWHHALRFLWTQTGDNVSAADLEALDGQGQTPAIPDVLTRTAADQDRLNAALRKRLRLLGVAPREVPSPLTPPGLVKPSWTASPDLFIGWATLDGPSYGQLRSQSRSTSRALLNRPRLPGWPSIGRRAWSAVLGSAVVAVIVGVVSLSYLPTVYSATWGNMADILTAIAAGLGGHVVINWAALPLFQSHRLRAIAAAAPPATPAPAPTPAATRTPASAPVPPA
jgi:hypothetical protein